MRVELGGKWRFLLVAGGAALLLASTASARGADWKSWWGSTSAGNGIYRLSSQPPASPAETHSALLTSAGTWGDQTFRYTATTLAQLRQGSAPNPWEVAWAMFRFRDLQHYYYFILKPNGFELGKKQGSDAQIFLVTGSAPRLALGHRNRIEITAVGPRIRVAVDGAGVLDYTDPQPLGPGSVGLYEEDADVQFANVSVTS
jgi:3-keto-disaccharide hydrolase